MRPLPALPAPACRPARSRDNHRGGLAVAQRWQCPCWPGCRGHCSAESATQDRRACGRTGGRCDRQAAMGTPAVQRAPDRQHHQGDDRARGGKGRCIWTGGSRSPPLTSSTRTSTTPPRRAACRRRAHRQAAALRHAAAVRRRCGDRTGRQLRPWLAGVRPEDERDCAPPASGQDALHQLRRAAVHRRVHPAEPAAARRGSDGQADHQRPWSSTAATCCTPVRITTATSG